MIFFRQTYDGFINVTTIINDIDAIVTSSIAFYGKISNHGLSTDCKESKAMTLILRNNTKCGNQCSRRSRDCRSRWWWTSIRYWKYLAYQFYPRFDFSKFQLWIKYLRLGYWCNACSCEPGRWSHWSFQRFVCPILLYFSLFGKTFSLAMIAVQSGFKADFTVEINLHYILVWINWTVIWN